MASSLFDGLSQVDTTGRLILATTLGTLVASVIANLAARARYASLARDVDAASAGGPFTHPVLADIARDVERTARGGGEVSTQAIVDDHVQGQLGSLLLVERFVRASPGLVIILGLMGTFYGLTLSIGKLVTLVGGDASAATDVAQAVTTGLTSALTGMAVAFSNSLVGIVSAVILTVVGVLSNVGDAREALLVRLEALLERRRAAAPRDDAGGAAARLDAAIARFEAALGAFAASTRDFTEFNAHLKDNVQRMSLGFGDLSATLKEQVAVLKRGNGAP